jgi:4-amino-4-deoxy-L-arabinose transferase-like glycosyltransferase
MPTRVRPRFGAAVWALLVVALVLRLAFVVATPDYRLTGDARDYDRHASSIAAGHGYSKTLAYGRPTAFRPPGFPYVLAAVYRVAGVQDAPAQRRIDVARVAQALVGTIVVALIGLLAAQLWGRRIGLIALALAAIYLPLILVGGSVISEPLFDVFLLGALIAAVQHRRSAARYRFVVLTGALAGLAILTRANAIALLAPLAVAAWDGRPRWAWRSLGPPAVLVVVAALVVAPWTVRNAVVLHAFVPVSTQLGSALAGTYNDEARTDRRDPGSWRSVKHVAAYRSLWARVRQTPEPELERKLRTQALRYAADHPLYVAEVGWWSMRRTLDLAGLHRSRHTAASIGIEPGWATAGVVCFWVFGALALAGCATRRARRTPAFVWAVPVLMLLSVVFLVVETPRYRTPIDPFVILLAALALVAAAARARRPQAPPTRCSIGR